MSKKVIMAVVTGAPHTSEYEHHFVGARGTVGDDAYPAIAAWTRPQYAKRDAPGLAMRADYDIRVVEVDPEDQPSAEMSQEERHKWHLEMSDKHAVRASLTSPLETADEDFIYELYAFFESRMQWHAEQARNLEARVRSGQWPNYVARKNDVRALIVKASQMIGISLGCASSSCIFGPTDGMHPHGTCMCIEQDFRAMAGVVKTLATALAKTGRAL